MTKILCPEAKENEFFSKKAFHRPSGGVFQGIKMWYFCQNSLSGIMSSYFNEHVPPKIIFSQSIIKISKINGHHYSFLMSRKSSCFAAV